MTAPSDLPLRIETSLGPPLVRRDPVWTIDLGGVPIIRGLSVLSRALAEMIAAQARTERVDISAERRLRPREHPELIAQLGIDLVKVSAELDVVESIRGGVDVVERRLRALLGSLQRQACREALLGADGGTPRALVADFGDRDAHDRFVLEFVPARHGAGRRGYLRITIESGAGRRLDLSTIPHVRMDDIEDRFFIAGSTRIAHTWTDVLRREAERGRRSFFERRHHRSHLFQQLDQAGLASLERVSVGWAESAVPFLVESEPNDVGDLLKRVLLSLEDRSVRRLLAERETVRVDGGPVSVHLDLAQLGRVLALSIGARRERADVGTFLARMPELRRVIGRHAPALPLSGVRVFLVHHMTGEVVGLIAALRALGCRDLVCLFVTYAGEAPQSYLDAVLDLPGDEFQALALANVPSPGHVEGHYRLSGEYARLADAGDVERALAGRDASYLDAMRAAALVPFLNQVARAEAAGERCLLVEDGGYLGPVIHEAMLAGRTVGDFAAEHGHRSEDERLLLDVLRDRCVGPVEHTRNGFDRLADVERRFGRLASPAFSIAISHLKRVVEAREVAASILTAVEAVLHADGRVLSRRRCLVLGSRGAIGSALCAQLVARLGDPTRQLAGLDVRVADGDDLRYPQARALGDLPPRTWLETELVLGVTGASVLSGSDVERWLLHGTASELFLVSGSTKKVEFAAVMRWLDDAMRCHPARIAGRAATIEAAELLDPRTGRVYGQRYLLVIDGVPTPRQIVCLAGLTPINFLFYGVPTESIDEVLAQLLSLSLGALRRAGDLEPRLHAVDRDVDADAAPIGA